MAGDITQLVEGFLSTLKSLGSISVPRTVVHTCISAPRRRKRQENPKFKVILGLPTSELPASLGYLRATLRRSLSLKNTDYSALVP